MYVGEYQTLMVDRLTDPGAYLTDGTTDVLLPTRYIPNGTKKGDKLNVFVYRDSEDRIICTTQKPYAQVNQFAYLKVTDTSNVGAFLDWGIDKDLLVPFREQKNKLKQGQWCLVYLYLDQKTDRIAATAKVAKYFDEDITVEVGEEVDLLVANTTDLGVNVVVNNKHKGLIFENDLFHDVLEGDRIKGYVKTIRTDGKLDISLRKEGLENLEVGAQQILDELKKNEGYLPIHDKSDPEEIQSLLQMSKKNFKRSVGILYKKRLVALENDGIRITN
ncbi:S1-like domain-containing RNA-binding protein [Ekhidna sp.]|jgi:predicted RNA-binding protein (virulence factor B family)|uniref:CvfB family protein n=1 Tax=Ekhidna sp. TaxID=2608089 RepID=UPI0032EDE15B